MYESMNKNYEGDGNLKDAPPIQQEKALNHMLNSLESEISTYRLLLSEFESKIDILVGGEPQNDGKTEPQSEPCLLESFERRLSYLKNLNKQMEHQLSRLDNVV